MLDSFVVIDVETTGLDPKKDRIIEIGAIKVEQGQEVEEFSILLNPQVEITGLITSLTGITNEMLMDKQNFLSIGDSLEKFLGEYPVLGHNVRFDYRFIKTEMNRIGKDFQHTIIDTLDIAKSMHEDLPSRSLENLCTYYGITNIRAHRAIHDARATKKLYDSMKASCEPNHLELFKAIPYSYKIKKEQPITVRQKNYLNDLMKYHKINRVQAIEELTKSQASRLIDKIILENGRPE